MVALECIMVDGVFGENCDILDVSGQLKTRLLS